MTVFDVLTVVTFIVDIFATGIAVGRYIESTKNNRPR